MKAFILSKLKITEDEFAKTVWLAGLFFLLVNGIFFGRNARDSLFLVKVGLPSLPYAYMLNAVLAIGCSFVYAMFVDKMDRFKLVRAILIIFIAALVGMFVFLQAGMLWFYWATYSIVQAIWLMSLMMFWTFAADFFDAVQSKRIFPLIGMGGLAGMITSGLIAKPLVKTFGTEKLFLAWAALLAAGLAVVLVLSRHRKPAAAKRGRSAPKKSQWEQLLDGFRNVRRTPLLLNMVVLILTLWLVFTLIDYQFSQVARARFTEDGVTNKDALTAFLGIFRSWAGICCLIFQVFLTPMVIRKVGVAGAMTFHPAFLLLSIGGMVMSFGFVSTCVTKFGDHVLLYTITDVAYQLLFNPIPAAQRGRARAFVEGYVKPFSMGLAGAVLLVLVELKLDPQQIAACCLCLAMVWFVSTLMLKKNYLQAVVSNLNVSQSGVPVLSALSAEQSEANIREMQKRIESENPDDILFAIEYFVLIKHDPAATWLVPLLKHENPSIRRMACRAVGELGAAHVLPHLTEMLRDKDTRVVREALGGIRRLGNEEQLPALNALRIHPDLAIVAETIETEAEIGGFDGILGTAEMLKSWSRSDDPRELELLASILGRLRIKSFLSVLLQLSKHANEKVSTAAIKALTQFKDERAMPTLIDALRNDILFPQIQQYFASCGKPYRDAILALYRNEKTRLRVKRRFLEAIAKNGKWDPSEILIEELRSDDPVIRFLCVKYLSERNEAAPAPDLITLVLKEEIEHWIHIETLREKLVGSKSSSETRNIVDLIFGEELHRTRKTVFLSLGFLKDRATLQRIYRNAFYGAANERALAMEAIENLGIKPWVGILLPLLAGGGPADAREARGQFLKIYPDADFDTDRFLGRLVAQSYEYLLSAILYAWRDNGDKTHMDIVTSLRSHTASLVREHAAAAAVALG